MAEQWLPSWKKNCSIYHNIIFKETKITQITENVCNLIFLTPELWHHVWKCTYSNTLSNQCKMTIWVMSLNCLHFLSLLSFQTHLPTTCDQVIGLSNKCHNLETWHSKYLFWVILWLVAFFLTHPVQGQVWVQNPRI